jgi:hypothetical protein
VHARGQAVLAVREQRMEVIQETLRSRRHGDAELPEQGAHGIDPGRAGGHPLGADPVERDEGLLVLALAGDGVNAGAAIGLEEGLTVGPIRLAPAPVRLHIVWGQQDHLEATGAEKASPEVRRGAAFQDDTTAKLPVPEPLELGPGKPLPLADGTGRAGDRDLENVLGQVHGDGPLRHGLGSFPSRAWVVWRSPRFPLVREESIPSLHLTPRCARRRLAPAR